MPDIVVIGGGVEGCSIAYHLARHGARVTLLDRFGISSAASGASAGGVRHQGRDPREFPLAFQAIERWRTLEVELDADLSYRREGHLNTCEHVEDLPALRDYVDRQAALGLDIRFVDGDELRELAPALSPSVIATAYSPNDGHADPAATTRAFAAAAERHGATIRAGVAAEAIELARGRVAGVRTDHGSFPADVVVLAAGAWSAGLAAGIGLELPIAPLGLQAMTSEPAAPVLRQVLTSMRRAISLKQLPDGRFLLGGGWPGEFSLDAPRGTTIPESRDGNRAAAVGIMPAVGATAIVDAWLGIEAITVDEVPIIGPVDGFEGLVLATGFCGHGFAISPAVGEAVAELIVTGLLPVSLAELTYARFAGKVNHEFTAYFRVG